MSTAVSAAGNFKRVKTGTPAWGVLWFLFPLAAILVYRQALAAISAAATQGGLLVTPAIMAAIAVPLAGLAIVQRSTAAAFAGYLTIAIPPLVTASGVLAGVAAHGGYWTALAVSVPTLLFGGGVALSLSPARTLMVTHRVAAFPVAIFVLAHLTNHLFALDSLATYKTVQDALRLVYRNPVVEALLIAALAVLILSGVAMTWRGRRRQGFLNHAQAASGLFIAVFLCSHVMAVLASGRALGHVDTDFVFASGGPAGLLHSPGAVRLIPYYFLAPTAFFAHIGGALRRQLLRKGFLHANGVGLAVFGIGVAVSTLILTALCRPVS